MSELVSDEEYKQEVRTKVSDEIDNQIAKEQISFFYPKCGVQRTALDDFCNSCGKDLRKLKKRFESKKME